MRNVVFVGTYPPRRCGLATFMADLRNALMSSASDLNCGVVAISDEASYDYPAEVGYVIRQNNIDDYIDAARRVNDANPDVVCIQHEFGIFGGPAGKYLIAFLDLIKCPVVSTLHTVLEHPDEEQKSVFEQILKRSCKLVVMAERGLSVLQHTWSVPARKAEIVPHGVPDRVLENNDRRKTILGFAGRELLLTFGLLSPDKSIESVIRAMPTIIAARPHALYVISGTTHPNLVAQEGERYRDSLQTLSNNLGITESVRFINKYLDTPYLLDIIASADICIMPYKNEGQITSGTLSYAAGLGKAIISTPFWHARELLEGDRGVLIPFGDHHALAQSVIRLLSDSRWRRSLEVRIFEASRCMVWSKLGLRYRDILLPHGQRAKTPAAAGPSLDATNE